MAPRLKYVDPTRPRGWLTRAYAALSATRLGKLLSTHRWFQRERREELLEPGMRRPDRKDLVRRLLTEQVLPSNLARQGDNLPGENGA